MFGRVEADILIALERTEALRYADFLKPDGIAVINDYAQDSITTAAGLERYPENCVEVMQKTFKTIVLDAGQIAIDLGNAKCMNVVLFGALCDTLGVPGVDWERVVAETVSQKVREVNVWAFHAGRTAAGS